jgi:transcriptional antiterminator RfaH
MHENKNASWHLLVTKPHKDAYAEIQLKNQGYDVYRPLASYLKNYRGKKVQIVGSLFPRYIFINIRDGIDDWGPIRSTLGVQNIVKFGIKPAKIDNAVIEGIRVKEDDLVERYINLDEFKAGQTIKIDEGPLTGLDAIFSNYSGEHRVIILLDFLGKQTSLSLDQSNISSL